MIFCSVPASFSRLNSDSLRMSSAFKSTIYENSRIHDNQAHAYGHVYGRWKTKQRMTFYYRSFVQIEDSFGRHFVLVCAQADYPLLVGALLIEI